MPRLAGFEDLYKIKIFHLKITAVAKVKPGLETNFLVDASDFSAKGLTQTQSKLYFI